MATDDPQALAPESQPQRDVTTGRFLPGHRGGPGGSRKMDPFVLEMLKAATPKAAQTLVAALDAQKAVVVPGGRDKPGSIEMVADWDIRVKAANAVFDRVHGKPAQIVTGDEGGPIKVDFDILGLLQRAAGV